MSGPLSGRRIIEIAGIGPGPFASMILSDLGAEVVRIDRPTDRPPEPGAVVADHVEIGAEREGLPDLGANPHRTIGEHPPRMTCRARDVGDGV